MVLLHYQQDFRTTKSCPLFCWRWGFCWYFSCWTRFLWRSKSRHLYFTLFLHHRHVEGKQLITDDKNVWGSSHCLCSSSLLKLLIRRRLTPPPGSKVIKDEEFNCLVSPLRTEGWLHQEWMPQHLINWNSLRTLFWTTINCPSNVLVIASSTSRLDLWHQRRMLVQRIVWRSSWRWTRESVNVSRSIKWSSMKRWLLISSRPFLLKNQ